METPKRRAQNNCTNNNNNDDNKNDDSVATTPSTPKAGVPVPTMDSPKTPVRAKNDCVDNYNDYYDDEELESPQFPHLIPVHHRPTSCDSDLDDVRIGWDDGYGSVFYRDDEHDSERYRRMRSCTIGGGRFTRRQQLLYGQPNNLENSESPSPGHRARMRLAIQTELNDYLGCVLKALSASKRERELKKMKALSETSTSASTSTNTSAESTNVSRLLDDSADDELMFLCSQAVEKTIASDANCNTINNVINLERVNSSIIGIRPLEETNNIPDNKNNVDQHAAKKFKPLQHNFIIKNENVPLRNTTMNIKANKPQTCVSGTLLSTNNVSTTKKKDQSSSFTLNDSLSGDDDLFSAIDLSAIEEQISSGTQKTFTSTLSTTQKCNAVKPKKLESNVNGLNSTQITNRLAATSSANSSNSSSVLWRRSCSSSSIVNRQPQLPQQNKKPYSSVNEVKIKSSNSGTTETITRYCTPAEIAAKRERARRTLLLKFKEKNKSVA